jgi:hypothetical protein
LIVGIVFLLSIGFVVESMSEDRRSGRRSQSPEACHPGLVATVCRQMNWDTAESSQQRTLSQNERGKEFIPTLKQSADLAMLVDVDHLGGRRRANPAWSSLSPAIATTKPAPFREPDLAGFAPCVRWAPRARRIGREGHLRLRHAHRIVRVSLGQSSSWRRTFSSALIPAAP